MKKALGILFYALVVVLGFGYIIFVLSGNDFESVLEGILLLIYILPPVILVAALIYGIFGGFNILLPVITAALSVGFVLYINGDNPLNAELFIIPLIGAVIALVGNAVGRIFYKKK